jgi:predicted transcriptional regulator
MERETLLLSVRPMFAQRILNGTKTAELRRVRPSVHVGQDVLIYSSSPTMALLASAVVERVESGPVTMMWPRVSKAAGVSHAEYLAYFDGAEIASAIWLSAISALDQPLTLSDLRKRWPWFRPPQSYCFVRAILETPGCLTSLAPRVAKRTIDIVELDVDSQH